jgi:peroxiredoxin
LLAVTPQPASTCSQTAERDLLSYPLLSDRGNAVAERYGVASELPRVLQSLLARLGHDVPRINGTGNWRLPFVSTFVLAPGGRVEVAHVEPVSWRQLEPSAAIKVAEDLQHLGSRSEREAL